MTASYRSGLERGKKKNENKTHIQNIFTGILEKYLEVSPKEWRGKIKYEQTVNCRVREYCHIENRSAKKKGEKKKKKKIQDTYIKRA